jgi:hypothetical protein
MRGERTRGPIVRISAVGVLLAAQASIPVYSQFGADRPLDGAAASHRVVAIRTRRLFDGKSDRLLSDLAVAPVAIPGQTKLV